MQQRPRSRTITIPDLLLVLGALILGAAGGFLLSEQRNAARYQEVQSVLVNLEQGLQIEERSRNAAALQTYFEQMTQLVLERGLASSDADSEVQRLARSRTLAIVANSDAEGNRSVTRFLTELDLVKATDPVRLLSQSHLEGADLGGAFLPAADLNTSTFDDANLSGAMLVSANLGGAILSDADLSSANLAYANLTSAELVGADLSGANLDRAILDNADLSGADLTDAAVTEEQLDACESAEDATMPDGTKHP